MKIKPFVYLAAPYTKGDTGLNVRSQILLFNELLDDNIVIPYAPLLTHYAHMVIPKSYNDWMDYCLSMLSLTDACFRSNAIDVSMDYIMEESSGADKELDFCKENMIPYFYNKDALYEWVNNKYDKLVNI